MTHTLLFHKLSFLFTHVSFGREDAIAHTNHHHQDSLAIITCVHMHMDYGLWITVLCIGPVQCLLSRIRGLSGNQ
jgi:hypothetical protein